MKVEPDYKSIGALFRDANVFRVPKYQRGYAWKQEQLEDFIDDIRCILNNEHGAEHFFGSLVCAQNETFGGHEKENQLVDGQQRLTTFVILASTLISKYELLNKEVSEHNQYIEEKIKELKERYFFYKKSVNKKTELVRRLTLSRRDDDFFNAIINGQFVEAERESHNRISQSFELLSKFILDLTRNKTVDEQLDCLDSLEKVINENCNVIHMVTSKVADAYKLFQVINDRGENLNHTDLLRAKTLGIADNRDNAHIFSAVENIWDQLDKKFGGSLEKLLGYYYSGITGEKVKSSSFYDQCMKNIFSDGKLSADEILQKMRNMYSELCKAEKIVNGEWPYLDSTLTAWQRNRLNILITNLKHTHPIPLLLIATNLPEKQYYELVRVIEIFFFRYKHICKNKIDSATIRYLKACKNISANNFTVQDFKKDLRELIHKDATDEQFVARISDLEYINPKSGDNRGMRYLLLGIEDGWRWYRNGMQGGSAGREKMFDYSAVYEFSSITLEHIYPQNPKLKNIELEQYLNNLGNITLLDPKLNASLGNIDYAEKLKFLVKDSKVLINNEFEKYPLWNREFLLERERTLIEAAKAIFIF